MKKVAFVVLAVFIFLLPIISYAAVYVHGYYRSNGTYVAPHYRSNPDGNPYNNYSYPGNTNPYTGVTATGNPDTYLKNYYNTSSLSSSTPYTSSYLSGSSYEQVTGGYKVYNLLFCNTGFYEKDNKCVKDPSNSTYEKVTGGYKSYSTLYCNNGYYKNNDKCVKAPEHSTASLSSFTCDSGYEISGDGQQCRSKDQIRKYVPSVVKMWVDNNPNIECKDSTFLRKKEKNICIDYKEKINKYDWQTSMKEFDDKYYHYDATTQTAFSCPDGSKILIENKKITNKCVVEK